MTTLGELESRTRRMLGDTGATPVFSSDFMLDACHAALDAILPYLQKASMLEYDGDGETTSFEMPTDLYKIHSVYDSESSLYIPRASMMPETAPGQNVRTEQDWVEYPSGYIDLATAPGDGYFIRLHYGATWTKPGYETDELETPAWADTGLCLYMASYVILLKAYQGGDIRQWNIDVDSGTPAMNPMRDLSTYFLDRFLREMQAHPQNIRGSA